MFSSLAFTALLTASSYADSVTLNAVNSGWYAYNGYSDGQASNIAISGDTYRDWLGFDLSSVNGTIVGATLKVASDPRNSSNQTINWWDVTSPYPGLGVLDNSAGRPVGKAVFADLGSGVLFGTGTHTAGTLNSFILNTDALASLNSSHSLWAIGGSEATPDLAFAYKNGVADKETIQLVLDVLPREGQNTVPESGSSMFMIGSACVGLLALRHRKRATA